MFYNGTMEQPDRTQLRLSDLFCQAEGVPCLECTATMININYGHNEEMMKSCRKLYEYAFLINAVRSRLNEGLHLEAAVDQAVEDCIQHDVLKNFLLKHREEVREMILSEYDEELHINSEKKISYEEGLEAGVVQGTQHGQERVNALITRLAAAGRADDIIRSAEDSAYQEQLFQEFGITKERFLQALSTVRGNQRVVSDNPEAKKYRPDAYHIAFRPALLLKNPMIREAAASPPPSSQSRRCPVPESP